MDGCPDELPVRPFLLVPLCSIPSCFRVGGLLPLSCFSGSTPQPLKDLMQLKVSCDPFRSFPCLLTTLTSLPLTLAFLPYV